jgi:hypothetical protein
MDQTLYGMYIRTLASIVDGTMRVQSVAHYFFWMTESVWFNSGVRLRENRGSWMLQPSMPASTCAANHANPSYPCLRDQLSVLGISSPSEKALCFHDFGM